MKFRKPIAALLFLSMLLGLAGCAAPAEDPQSAGTGGLTEGDVPSSPAAQGAEPLRTSAEKAADFAVRLFRKSLKDGENTLVSPLSVLSALAMTANGARGDTLAEMEKVLGMKTEELNAYFKTCLASLAEDGGVRFHLANSIWFTDDARFTVSPDFLRTNTDYYGAGTFRVPFDEETLKDINGWVNENTDGMIPQILDRIPEDAVMFLVNALAFEGEWAKPYFDYQVSPGEFTLENGTKKTVDFMYSEESLYLSDGDAVGFFKPYADGRYAFAALLPKEGTAVSDYASSLDGEKLIRLLASAEDTPVEAAMPKFETGYGTELSDVLKEMGMPAAFNPGAADFTGLGASDAGNIYISRVLHKTFISVGERGTKAGAATVVEMEDGCALLPEEPKRVTLDRPFVYMLVDRETNTPFFIGAFMAPEG